MASQPVIEELESAEGPPRLVVDLLRIYTTLRATPDERAKKAAYWINRALQSLRVRVDG